MARRKREPLLDAIEDAKIGHNSALNKSEATQLRSYMLAHNHFDEQRAEISFERAEMRKEMRDKGFDMKAFDEMRRRDKIEDKQRFENTVDSYAHACGLLGALRDTPLGDASLARDFGSDHEATAGAS
jgi:uncharacterized protein (UPF0335 family)